MLLKFWGARIFAVVQFPMHCWDVRREVLSPVLYAEFVKGGGGFVLKMAKAQLRVTRKCVPSRAKISSELTHVLGHGPRFDLTCDSQFPFKVNRTGYRRKRSLLRFTLFVDKNRGRPASWLGRQEDRGHHNSGRHIVW